MTMPRRISLSAAALAAAVMVGLAAPPPAQAGCSKRVILYDATWCPYCRQVRAILARNKIRYSVRNADNPRVQAEMIKRFGDASVPRTVIGRSVVHGVNESRIRQLCR